MTFNTITGDDWRRELKAARATANSVREQIRAKLDRYSEIGYNTRLKQMNILKYLPEKSEYAAKLATELSAHASSIYVVGSAARKGLYGLKTDVKDYDFVVSDYDENEPFLCEDLAAEYGDKCTHTPSGCVLDCESFTAKIRIVPIDRFLTSVRFAGDGLAVRVSDGRPIVLPEYMTLTPTTQIREVDKNDGQNDPVWEKAHLEVLAKFQDDLFKVVQEDLTSNEPTKS